MSPKAPTVGERPLEALRLCLPFIFNPPSLDAHIILDRLHAFDAACNLDGLVDVRLGTDKAAQLNHALEGFDVDFGGFQGWFIDDGRFHFRSQDGVIDVFPGPGLL